MRRSHLIAGALLLALGSACFSVSEPACSYRCGPNAACPERYTCGADGYCHLDDHDAGICTFPDAAGVD